MASDLRVNFPVVGAVIGADGKLVLNPISESVPIRAGYAKLSQVPFQDTKQSVNVAIEGMAEIPTGEPLAGQYRVNYITGRVYFHDTANGTVAKAVYQGKGTLVAEDEINWLWENVNRASENLYYVALNDTPSVLIPRAVQVADPTGTKIEQMSPEIGRSHSETVVLRSFPGTYRFQGSLFDWITVWRLTTSEANTETKSIATGYTDALLLANGRYSATGADGHFYSSDVIFYPASKKITRVAMPSAVGNVGLLVSMGGVYHRMRAGVWEKVGTLNAIRTLPFSDWNTLADYASLSQSQLSALNDQTLNFAVYCLDGGSFAPELTVSNGVGFGYEKVEFGAEFDRDNQEWVLTMPSGQDYAVIIGSGKDDMSCTSEVIEFKDVLPGEMVQVTAPVRTNVNVLVGDTTTEDSVLFPATLRRWSAAPWDTVTDVRTFAGKYAVAGACAAESDITTVFSAIGNIGDSASLMDYRYGMPGKNLLGNSTKYSTDVEHPFPAMSSVGVISKGNDAAVGSNAVPGAVFGPQSLGASDAHTVGVTFKVLSQNSTFAVVMSSSNTRAHSLTVVASRNKVRLCRNLSASPVVLREVDIEEGVFNHVILTSCVYSSYTSGINAFYTVSYNIYVNGVRYNGSHKLRNDGGGGSAYSRPNVAGLSQEYAQVMGGTHPGVALLENPFHLPRNITLAEAEVISAHMRGLNSAKPNVDSTAWLMSSDLFANNIADSNDLRISTTAGWNYAPEEPLYAFYDGYEIFTLDRETQDRIKLYGTETYDTLAAYCATATTLRAAKDKLNTPVFRRARLVVVSKDFGGMGRMWGIPGQFVIDRVFVGKQMRLARDADVTTAYVDGQWQVTSHLATAATIRLAVLGGGLSDYTAPNALKFFTELLDTPNDLNDLAPKALVSHNGSVAKALHVHPYLLGGI